MKTLDGLELPGDWKLFTEWKFGGVVIEDYPDFSDFFLESVKCNGLPLNDEQLKELHELYPDEIYNIMFDQEMDRQADQADYQRDLMLERQEMEDFAQDGDFENMDGSEIL